MIQADKKQILPNELLDIRREMRKNTWVQNLLGTDVIVTNEPENLKALLATQFTDFEIGPQRRGNFFPAFGNGIFTTDGKPWYVASRNVCIVRLTSLPGNMLVQCSDLNSPGTKWLTSVRKSTTFKT
jgi:hypothetical protein